MFDLSKRSVIGKLSTLVGGVFSERNFCFEFRKLFKVWREKEKFSGKPGQILW